MDGASWDTNRWQISQRDTNHFDIAYGAATNTNVGVSNTVLRIKTDGKVGLGLGSTDPSQALHVSGTIRQTNATSAVLVADANGDISAASNLTDATFLAAGAAENDAFTVATPGAPTNWVGGPPATIGEALNRIAAALNDPTYTIGSPIPQ